MAEDAEESDMQGDEEVEEATTPEGEAAQANLPEEDRPYLGLSKDEAAARADGENRKWRVVSEDGRQFPVTMDYRPERLNFTIKAGKVVRVTRG